jgi:hypothetical protein
MSDCACVIVYGQVEEKKFKQLEAGAERKVCACLRACLPRFMVMAFSAHE